MSKMRTACGFVLHRRGPAGLEYLLLTNAERGEAGFPKGHSEPGEDEIQTALRETEEETGLTDIDHGAPFRRVLEYPATRDGVTYHKQAIYLLGALRSGTLRLSEEHAEGAWLPYASAYHTLPYASLRSVLREAALYLKDPALFETEPAEEVDADAHLRALPQATSGIVHHLRGGARLARVFAKALEAAGVRIHVEACAAGTLLHDVGRALGDHADHPRAGLRHLRESRLAPYGFACMSHFTKGASIDELVEHGVDPVMLGEVAQWIDLTTLTWEERCAALADACMKQDQAVPPAERFEDLRRRYDAQALIGCQERHTAGIRKTIAEALGRDPLELVGLD